MNSPRPGRRAPAPLDSARLNELALRYVSKYATSRAKLANYLTRKLRERGFAGGDAPDVAAIANRFAQLGYIDDAAFALAQSRSISARGYGKRRLTDKLRQAGIDEDDRRPANEYADAEAVEAALRFAAKRRIGPFAADRPSPRQREKWIAAMVRAGHGFAIARALVAAPPGSPIDIDELTELADNGGP